MKSVGSVLCLRVAPVAQPPAVNDFVPPPPLQMFSDDLEKNNELFMQAHRVLFWAVLEMLNNTERG